MPGSAAGGARKTRNIRRAHGWIKPQRTGGDGAVREISEGRRVQGQRQRRDVAAKAGDAESRYCRWHALPFVLVVARSPCGDSPRASPIRATFLLKAGRRHRPIRQLSAQVRNAIAVCSASGHSKEGSAAGDDRARKRRLSLPSGWGFAGDRDRPHSRPTHRGPRGKGHRLRTQNEGDAGDRPLRRGSARSSIFP